MFKKSSSGVKHHRKILRDNIQGIKKPAIKRLSQVAGIGILGGDVYDEVRQILKIYLQELVKYTVTYVEHARRKTVSGEDVRYAYEQLTGRKIYDDFHTRPGCKVYYAPTSKVSPSRRRKRNPVDVMESQIKFYRKQSDCLFFDKTSFTRLIREVGQDYNYDLKWTDAAKTGLQVISEDYIIQLFDKARDIAQIAGRVSVSAKDVQMGRRFCGTNHIRQV